MFSIAIVVAVALRYLIDIVEMLSIKRGSCGLDCDCNMHCNRRDV